MGLAQAFPILGNQGCSVEEHARLVLDGGAAHIRNVGVDTITIEIYRARRLGRHERGGGKGDNGINRPQWAGLRGVKDVHLGGLRKCVRLWGTWRGHERVSHDNASIIRR
jgi:hypothetical protein